MNIYLATEFIYVCVSFVVGSIAFFMFKPDKNLFLIWRRLIRGGIVFLAGVSVFYYSKIAFFNYKIVENGYRFRLIVILLFTAAVCSALSVFNFRCYQRNPTWKNAVVAIHPVVIAGLMFAQLPITFARAA